MSLPPGFGSPGGDMPLGAPLAARRSAWRRWPLVLLAFALGLGAGSALGPDDDLRDRLAAAEQRAREAEARFPLATVAPSPFETESPSPTVPATPSATPTPRPTVNPHEDDGWQAVSLTAGCEVGRWSGTARVRNTNVGEHNGTFTFTLFRGGRIVGTLRGNAQNVDTGRTVTVRLGSPDGCTAGSYTYELQTDASF